MLLKNLETELQHTTFDRRCRTFYTNDFLDGIKPMNVQLPETLKKVIQQYLISWMFHNTVCGDETRSIRPWKEICGGFRKRKDFSMENHLKPWEPIPRVGFYRFQLPRRLGRSFSTKAGLFFSKGKIAQVIGATHGWNLPDILESPKSNSKLILLHILSRTLETQKIANTKKTVGALCQFNNWLPSYFKFNTLLAKRKTQSRHQKTGPMPKQNPSTNSFSHALLQPLENPKASKRFNKWLTAYGSVEYFASIMIASHHRSHPHRRHYTTAPKTNDRYLAVLLRCLPRCQWCCQPVELFMKEDLRKFSDTYSSQKKPSFLVLL